MASKHAEKCHMCNEFPLEPIPRSDGTPSQLLECKNCDNPKGKMPQSNGN